jgi:holo-[acyl-carrier protein] synthase
MPIKGIGIDLVKVERLMASLERFGHRMESRLFTPDELEYCRRHRDPVPHLAARFAAKEAAAKALGTGMSGGVAFRQFEVVQPGGQVPRLRFSGAALERFEALGCRTSHLSLTHDGGLAIACVVIEG